MAEKDTRNVHQRILAMMEVVQYIQKEPKGGMPYRAVSHDRVTKKCRGELLKQGVHYYTTVVDFTQSGNRTEMVCDTWFVNSDNPEDKFPVRTVGYGIDSQDKGPGKAQSYCTKGALLKTAGLETGTENEVDFHNEDYNADPQPNAPPELAEVTQQAADGRPKLIEAVQKWLLMDDVTVKKQTAKALARALSEMINVYHGPSRWFTEHIKDHPDHGQYYMEGDGAKIVGRMQKNVVVRIFLKYRLRVLDMAEFNKYDYATVGSHINALNGMKAGVDIYSKTDEEFADMVQQLHNELKG